MEARSMVPFTLHPLPDTTSILCVVQINIFRQDPVGAWNPPRRQRFFPLIEFNLQACKFIAVRVSSTEEDYIR